MEEKMVLLTNEINQTLPMEEEILIWWLGQSGFIIKTNEVCIGIDLYLSTTLEDATVNQPWNRHVRMTPIPVIPQNIQCLDYICCSHVHGDHYDPATLRFLLQGSPHAKIILPSAVISQAIADGFSKNSLIPLGTKDKFVDRKFEILGIPAKHNEFDYTEEHSYPYLGFLLKLKNQWLYHAGDTIFYEDLPKILQPYSIAVAMLPINGWTEELIAKGFASNLTYKEAVNLCEEAKVKCVIPCHYDMFPINTEQVGRFVNYMNQREHRIPYLIPVIGDIFSLKKEG